MSDEEYYNLFDLSKEKLILKIKLLQQENKQLKEENNYLKLNCPEQNLEHFRIIRENKRKIDNLRTKVKLKEELANKYKKVIEQAREEIEKSILIEGVKETGVGYYENIKANKTKLLQILDKVKEMNKI